MEIESEKHAFSSRSPAAIVLICATFYFWKNLSQENDMKSEILGEELLEWPIKTFD